MNPSAICHEICHDVRIGSDCVCVHESNCDCDSEYGCVRESECGCDSEYGCVRDSECGCDYVFGCGRDDAVDWVNFYGDARMMIDCEISCEICCVGVLLGRGATTNKQIPHNTSKNALELVKKNNIVCTRLRTKFAAVAEADA